MPDHLSSLIYSKPSLLSPFLGVCKTSIRLFVRIRDQCLAVGIHEIVDRSDISDGNELGKRIDAEFEFELRHEKCKIKRCEPQMCAQLRIAGQRSRGGGTPLGQDRPDLSDHSGFDLMACSCL